MVFGLATLLIGLFFFLQNTGIIEEGFWTSAWPIVVMLLGAFMIFGSRNSKCKAIRHYAQVKHQEK